MAATTQTFDDSVGEVELDLARTYGLTFGEARHLVKEHGNGAELEAAAGRLNREKVR